MTRVWKEFSIYTVIGIASALLHGQLFFFLQAAFDVSQALGNFLAFCAAASFAFYCNALYTFAMPASVWRYVLFMLCMGGLSLLVGGLADRWQLPGIVTVLVFSLISLVVGFLLSKWLVFRVRDS